MSKIHDDLLSDLHKDQLISEANRAMANAYSPYSQFKVGAAVLTASGNIYSGCNAENASYGLTMCAERVAVFSAIAHEGPHVRLKAVLIASDPKATTPPCGACRQVLSEFGDDSLSVYFPKAGVLTQTSLSCLLPEKFVLLS